MAAAPLTVGTGAATATATAAAPAGRRIRVIGYWGVSPSF